MMFKKDYGPLLVITMFAVENIMVCRVHRAIILGLMDECGGRRAPFVLTTFVTGADTAIDDRAVRECVLDMQQ